MYSAISFLLNQKTYKEFFQPTKHWLIYIIMFFVLTFSVSFYFRLEIFNFFFENATVQFKGRGNMANAPINLALYLSFLVTMIPVLSFLIKTISFQSTGMAGHILGRYFKLISIAVPVISSLSLLAGVYSYKLHLDWQHYRDSTSGLVGVVIFDFNDEFKDLMFFIYYFIFSFSVLPLIAFYHSQLKNLQIFSIIIASFGTIFLVLFLSKFSIANLVESLSFILVASLIYILSYYSSRLWFSIIDSKAAVMLQKNIIKKKNKLLPRFEFEKYL